MDFSKVNPQVAEFFNLHLDDFDSLFMNLEVYFRQYMIVGSMPQAVSKYTETRDFEKIDEIKRDILRLYRNDIQKYAYKQKTKIAAITQQSHASD